MIGVRLALVTISLMVLPGSCIAAPPQRSVAPPVALSVKPALAPPQSVQSLSVGRFALNRMPQQGSLSIGRVPIGVKRLVIDGRPVSLAADGRFIVGFGRDYAQTTQITATLGNGTVVTERLPVTKRAWKIENLSKLPLKPQPDAEFDARRPAELAQINAARRLSHTVDGWQQPLIWPARGRISGFFGSQRIYAGQPGGAHSGVDVAAPAGTKVIAPANGVVILAAASPFTLEGNLLMIDHGMGLSSAFLHLSRIDVRVGDRVTQGQLIGAVGKTGRTTGPHLHWGMRWLDQKIDPQPLAGQMRL